jgi:hypothetical protein
VIIVSHRPFFNVEHYAAENLRSLVANAAPGIEFVLVDDGSRRLTRLDVRAAASAATTSEARPSGSASTPVCGGLELHWANGCWAAFPAVAAPQQSASPTP